jgi:flagellar FliL protein
MAEKKGPQISPETPETGSKKKKLIFIIAGAVVLLLLITGTAIGLYLFLNSDEEDKSKSGTGMEVPVPELKQNAGIGPMININEFIVNIISAESNHYVKASFTLELSNETVKEEVNQRMPQIRDSILLLVGNKTYDELQDLQGKKQLKAEISSKVNAVLQTGRVTSIYFTDFVVQ